MARLTAKGRAAVPKSQVANPGKYKKNGGAVSGSYPIPDRGHAIAALRLVNMHGDAATKKRVRAAVAKKYPELGRGSKRSK